MNIWHDINKNRIKKNDFLVCIEISQGSKKKYELDKETGYLILDRVLHTSTHYPANYGFLPKTYSGDHDPLDVLVLCDEILDPMTTVRCYPIGVVKMIDEEEIDEKIIAIPFGDPSLNMYHDISELPTHKFNEISHFFTVYKQLEGKTTFVKEILSRKEAEQIIQESIDAYQELFENKI